MSSRQAQCSTTWLSSIRQKCMNGQHTVLPVTGAPSHSGIIEARWVPRRVMRWATTLP